MAEPLNATFFAFKKRDKSGVLLGASVAYLVVTAALLAGFVAINMAAIGPVVSWYGQIISSAASGKPADPSQLALPDGAAIFFLSIIPFMFAFYIAFAAYEAACLRWMIRGETGGLAGLTLGADTWRVYLTYWVWFFLYIAVSLVSGIISAALLAGVMMGNGGASGDFSTLGPVFLASLAVRLLIYAVMIYFGVRLAPAAATSIGRKRFSFFDAWKVTKGRFWSLFGAFFLLCVIILVGEIVIFGVVIAVFFAGLLPAIIGLGSNPDGQQVMALFSALFTPQNLIVLAVAYLVVMALSLVVYVLFFGINARAVLAAAEEGKIDGMPSAAAAQTFE